MPKAERVERGQIGKRELRLMLSGGRYHELADGKPVIGENADNVRPRLHSEAGTRRRA